MKIKIKSTVKSLITHLKSAVSSYLSKCFNKLSKKLKLERFKTPKAKAIIKMVILGAYCTLICAAILFSFKSVFNRFTGFNDTQSEMFLPEKYISEILDNSDSDSSHDVLSKIGSRGDEVIQVQTALKNMGYYLGGADGEFGVKTQDALMRFQKARGIEADGIVGPETLKALGLSIDAISANYENDIYLLAKLISAEARNEPYAAQVAVGAVVLNRVENPSFPNSISAVIYQPDAFLSLKDGRFDEPVTESAYRAASDALNNADPVCGALYYYNPKTVSGETKKIMRTKTVAATFGSYVFCS